MQEKRLTKLESELDGREKVLAWIYKHQETSGFEDLMARWIETCGGSVQMPDIDDVEAAFTLHCWRECNLRVLELEIVPLQKLLFGLYILRSQSADYIVKDEFELQLFRQLVKLFVLQWMMLDRIVKIISEEHFSGMRVLYEDTAAMLKKDLERAEIYLAGFNVKIAPRLGLEPITSSELEICLLADVPREVEAITLLARAKAELDLGNRFAGFTLVSKFGRGYESKAEDSFRQAMAKYKNSVAAR